MYTNCYVMCRLALTISCNKISCLVNNICSLIQEDNWETITLLRTTLTQTHHSVVCFN